MLTFNAEKAGKADSGSYISQGGVYTVRITRAECFSSPSGAGGIEFTFEDDDNGAKCDFVKVYTKNKDGSENFAIGKIHALMGLLELSKAEAKTTDGKTTIIDFVGKYISVALRREEYPKSDNSIGYKFEVLHFFDAQTKQTYRELIGKRDAKTCLVPIKDKYISGSDFGNSESYSQPAPIQQEPKEDLPF